MTEKKIILKAYNIFCRDCAEHFELAMLRKDYVNSARADVKKGLVFLKLNKKISNEELEKDIAKKGYKTKVISIK